MSGINKQILVGFLGNDPELKTFPNGSSLVNFSVVTTESWTDRNTGEEKTHKQWHKIVARNQLAERALKGLNKGAKVYLEGKYKSRTYQCNTTGVEKEVFEVHLDVLEMCYNPLMNNDKFNNEEAESNQFNKQSFNNNPHYVNHSDNSQYNSNKQYGNTANQGFNRPRNPQYGNGFQNKNHGGGFGNNHGGGFGNNHGGGFGNNQGFQNNKKHNNEGWGEPQNDFNTNTRYPGKTR